MPPLPKNVLYYGTEVRCPNSWSCMLGRCLCCLRTEICATSAMETERSFGGFMPRCGIATGAPSRRAFQSQDRAER